MSSGSYFKDSEVFISSKHLDKILAILLKKLNKQVKDNYDLDNLGVNLSLTKEISLKKKKRLITSSFFHLYWNIEFDRGANIVLAEWHEGYSRTSNLIAKLAKYVKNGSYVEVYGDDYLRSYEIHNGKVLRMYE